MIQTHNADDTVVSVLATSIEVGNLGLHSLNALVMLESSKFAFVGSLNYETPAFYDTPFSEMLVNVVTSDSLQGVEAEARRFVTTHTERFKHLHNFPNYDEEMPWQIEHEHSYEDIAGEKQNMEFPHLVIEFCDQGMRGGEGATIHDPLLPSENDVLEWNSAFMRAYCQYSRIRFKNIMPN